MLAPLAIVHVPSVGQSLGWVHERTQLEARHVKPGSHGALPQV
jgi:hypothetical protein